MVKENPLYTKWNTPFGSPPFQLFTPEMYLPAIKQAISDAMEEIRLITSCKEPPGFTNTIEELEKAGRKVGEIAAVLFNLNMAETNPDIQKATQDVSPVLTRFSNDITLNRELFARVKSVAESDESKLLGTEESQLLKKRMRSFILGGAGLGDKDSIRFREINEELATLSLNFEENVLAETNSFELHITDTSDLAGLPDGIVKSAREEALSREKDGWIFTLHHPSYIPFMQYADNRRLREKLFMGYSTRCLKGNSHDNRENVKKLVNLRLELAKLLGYQRYADLVLEDRMAGSTENVTRFLQELFNESRESALRDREEVSRYAHSMGHTGALERWDWAYWSEKLKMERINIDDELLRPYLQLDRVEQAIFNLAGTLWGISFRRRDDIPLYHNEVRAFEVNDQDGTHLGLLMVDYHPRKGKSGGAWMTNYREQYQSDGIDTRPVISIVTNFSRASAGIPSLLTHNELTTLLHEFGHAMHGMLSKCHYESLSGTNVARDFVELPSQIMENWAYEKEWLDTWASHYISGEKIPEETIEMIKSLHTFNEGYSCNRQLSFGMLDMAWHTLEEEFDGNVDEFEQNAFSSTELFRVIEGTNMSCSFGHLFSGGYAAGYYGYKWAEVLDADAFSLFREKGITDKETSYSFRKNILEKGATGEPSVLYLNFRGKEPSIEPLLERSGFKKE